MTASRPSARTCPECHKPVPAGIVRHPDCFREYLKESAA